LTAVEEQEFALLRAPYFPPKLPTEPVQLMLLDIGEPQDPKKRR
jgi:hypothetical protein